MDNATNNPPAGGEQDPRLPVVRSDGGQQSLALAQPRGTALVQHYPQAPASAPSEQDEIDLREYWRILVKRKWWIVSAAVIAAVLAILVTLLTTPIYRATVTAQIQETVIQVIDVGETAPRRGWSRRGYYETQLELIRSRSLAQRVAADLGLADSRELAALQPPSAWEKLVAMVSGTTTPVDADPVDDGRTPEQRESAAAAAIAGGLSITPGKDSELVRIHFDSPDPAFARRAANAIADGFVAGNIERRFDSSAYAKTYLEDRLAELKVKLQDSERELVEFAQKEGIVGNRGGAGTLTEQNLDSVNASLATARSERVRAETRWRQAQASTGAVVAGRIGSDSIVKTLQESRAKLMADYQNKLAVYKPSFPSMLELKGQIDELDRQIAEEVESIKNAIRAEYEAALAQERTLAEMLDGMKDEVLDLQSRSIQYNILKREVDTNRELYDGLLQRYKEIGVAAGVSANNLSIIDRAEGAFRVKPNPQRNLMLGLLAGLLLGALLALAIEYLDDTVKSPEDIESKLRLVNLGGVPRLAKETTPAQAVADLRSAFAESYRSIRTALQFSTERGIPSVLAITSTSPGEGKSTTALTLARNFAQLGKRVLLIDADLRNPSLHKALGIDNAVGLSNCLAGSAKPGEAVKQLDEAGISVLTSGPLPPNPAELLAGAKMVSLLAQAAERYDHVVIDSPPVVGLADAPIVANLASGTLLIVEAGRARVGAVQASVKRLLSARAHLLGAVLTKFDARTAGYGYGSYNYMSYDYYSYGAPAGKRLLGRR